MLHVAPHIAYFSHYQCNTMKNAYAKKKLRLAKYLKRGSKCPYRSGMCNHSKSHNLFYHKFLPSISQ